MSKKYKAAVPAMIMQEDRLAARRIVALHTEEARIDNAGAEKRAKSTRSLRFVSSPEGMQALFTNGKITL